MNVLLALALLLLLTGLTIITVLGIVGTYLLIAGKFMRFSPPVPSSGKIKKKMLDHIAQYLKKQQNLTVVDLGSGWGTLLLPLAQNFPNHRFIGYELAKLPYYVSKLRALKLQNIQIKKQNFFSADFSDIDVILCFLLPSAMQQCHDKILPNLKEGTIICANRFPLPNTEPTETISLDSDYETFYVYKI